MVAIPQSGLLAQVSLPRPHSGHSGRSGQIPTLSNGARASLPSPHFPVRVQASVLLLHWGSYCWARNMWGLIIYLFFLPAMLPSCFQGSPQTQQGECFQTSLFLRLPFQDGAPSLPLLSHFLSFIFFPTCFQRQ